MSHDGDEGDGDDEEDGEDEGDEGEEEDDDDVDDDDDSTPDASPRAEAKVEGESSTGIVGCANQPVEPDPFLDGDDSGTEEEQAAFMVELERFHREHGLEFKPPKFYGKGLNCLKLWRQVAHLGGHEQVTICKLWRQVGETFRPPKTCTTVSWSFRIFYEKALLEYEKYKVQTGQLQVPLSALPQPGGTNREIGMNQSSSARVRRDAAARAMHGWHAHRLLTNSIYGDQNLKEKESIPSSSRGVLKRKKASSPECAIKVSRTKINKSQDDSMVTDVGEPAEWVKINVRQTKDCFEIYALVPGLLREEVHVQSDPAGRLVITGDPEQPDNPWGITPFKKVVNLPLRIDPHQTSAVVTLHGQLFVRAPFGHADM
uniref:ARID domain-containing protein n=2 Tax=Oryza brachyantha TaxID=4533 RepID=J3LGF7_ORYBR